jgi:hypothetical protein
MGKDDFAPTNWLSPVCLITSEPKDLFRIGYDLRHIMLIDITQMWHGWFSPYFLNTHRSCGLRAFWAHRPQETKVIPGYDHVARFVKVLFPRVESLLLRA